MHDNKLGQRNREVNRSRVACGRSYDGGCGKSDQILLIILVIQRQHLANVETDYFPMKMVSTKQSMSGWHAKRWNAGHRKNGLALHVTSGRRMIDRSSTPVDQVPGWWTDPVEFLESLHGTSRFYNLPRR